MSVSDFETLSRDMANREEFNTSLIFGAITLLIAMAIGWALLTEWGNVARGSGSIISSLQPVNVGRRSSPLRERGANGSCCSP